MIYTSSYKKCRDSHYHTYSISKDMGCDASYVGDAYLKLAPKEDFFRVWRNNIGKISEKENTEYYIREFYNQVLKNLDPKEVYNEVDNSILLCYEDNMDFCHRHLVAAWFELYLGLSVYEVNVNGYDIKIVDKPNYIKEYLEKVIREENNLDSDLSISDMYFAKKSCEKKKVLVKKN